MSQLCSYFGVQANASAAQPTSIAPSPAQNVQQPGPRYSSILPNPQAPPHCQYPRFYPHRVSNSVGPQSQQTPQSESPSSSNAHSPSATNENTNSFQLSTRNNPLNRSAQSNLGEGTSQAFYINRHPPVQSVISVATQVLDVDDDSVAKRRFGFWPNPSVEIPLDPHHYPHGTSNCVIPQSQHSPQSESPSSNAHSSNATNGNPNPFQLSTRNTPLNRSAQSNLGEGASQAFYINRHPPVQSVISVATQVLDVDDDSVVKRRFGFRPNPSVEIPPDPQSPNNYPHGTSNCAIPQSQHSPQSESPSSNAHITSATNEDPTLLQPSLQNRHTQSNLDGGASQAPIIHRHMPLQSDISAATQLQQWDIDDGGFEAEWRNYFWPET
ncbi:hypothetical protein EV426DRAFT_625399 [Tirmania nivea]|nr:hypothetical protein EV426DRAFT_625399 [Tirmania nivea]